MKYFLLLTSLSLLSCASVRPGPVVAHKVITNKEVIAKDIIACEKAGDRDEQIKCLNKKGYSVVNWN
ncbi:hypothetical protein [Halobacteriovorax sp. HLS]|uniref:hypothetical protein n=1 Tax=Halobacteriovorax sp. HLS TaxID=2234000 RepID=UPI000FDC31D0|nr:hypothetical protein [Halobacteriovorax sp. HLS]